MIDSGQADYAVIVDAEGSRFTQELTLERLAGDETTAVDLRSQFATLTLGSGSAAMVLGRADRHPEGHRVIGGVSRSGTEHHDLCVGDLTRMRTDTKRLFDAGLALALATWADAEEEFAPPAGEEAPVEEQVGALPPAAEREWSDPAFAALVFAPALLAGRRPARSRRRGVDGIFP